MFRGAFSGVTPAHSMFGPTPSAARDNKKVLMDALGPYGITNERLDEVSNQYRYPPGPGYVWKHVPACATAIVTDGKVTGFQLINAGSGYLTDPTVSVMGHESVKVKASVRFTEDFTTNGSIKSLTVERATRAVFFRTDWKSILRRITETISEQFLRQPLSNA